jgi:hypothetical protein
VSPGNPPLAVTVFADFFRLDSIGGLPEGLIYTTDAAFDTTYDAVTDPFGYWINPGDTTTGFSNTTGCISIEGDAAAWTAAAGGGPNSDGIYPLTLFIDARAANFYPAAIGGVVGFNTWLTEMGALLDAFGDPNFTVNGIRLEGAMLEVLESGVGINESEPTVTNISVYPNPSNDLATISYQAFEREVGYVRIFNALGESVYQESVSTIAGNNSLNVDCSKMESGLYIVMLEFETQSHNLKLLVP